MTKRIELEDITPEGYRCTAMASHCPAVFRTPEGKIVIIGKRYSNKEIAQRTGIDEASITIDEDMIKRALNIKS
jgi:hypothetical protein